MAEPPKQILQRGKMGCVRTYTEISRHACKSTHLLTNNGDFRADDYLSHHEYIKLLTRNRGQCRGVHDEEK